jgi:DNA-directed RNA polymerase sigma subunit (sigma70/sigma32)
MSPYCEGIVLPEDHLASAANSRMSTAVGTYSLRRAHYMTGTRVPQLSQEHQSELIQPFRDGNDDARRKLVASNMHLVVDFAKRYSNRGLSLLDMVRVGTQGIIESLETFDLDGGQSLSAYTSRCICRCIEDAITNRNHSAGMLRAAAPQLATFVNGTQRRA